MVKYAVVFVLFVFAIGGAYLLGRSHSELKVVTEQIEVIKYVDKKKAEIYSKPNASRDELLRLLNDGKL